MPYYHATKKKNLPSILRHGLGAMDIGPNSVPCPRGVYLASDPSLSIMVMLDHYLTSGDQTIRPPDELDSWIVILIDDARIDQRNLRQDPILNDEPRSFLYLGKIDANNALILSVDEIMDANL